MTKMTERGNHRTRWQTDTGKRLAQNVLSLLTRNKSLSGLALDRHEGRIDLRGLVVEEPRRRNRIIRGRVLHDLVEPPTFKSVHLAGLDLSGSALPHARFTDSRVEDCLFVGADCTGWRLWRTTFVNCDFAGSDLRGSQLGAYDGGPNTYSGVRFDRADMRAIFSSAAAYEDCSFDGSRLEKVDFQSSSFVRCRFAGRLSEVIFYAHGYKTGKPDPNRMEDVDMRDAVLRDVEFRGLDLDRMAFPTSSDHLVVAAYKCVLSAAVAELTGIETADARQVKSMLELRLKWAGPNQRIGVFNIEDLALPNGASQQSLALRVLNRGIELCEATTL